MTVKLNCVDKEHRGEKWQLELGDDVAVLSTPNGEVVTRFTPSQAHAGIELLRFGEDGHNVAISVAEYTWHFTAWPKGFKAIKTFTQQAPEASSGGARAKIKRRAIFQSVIGGSVMLAGLALTLAGYLDAAASDNRSSYAIYYGAIVVGASVLFKGMYHFREHRSLTQLATAA